MPQHHASVAIYATHDQAETAIRKVAQSGLDMRRFTIVGGGYRIDGQAVGFCSAGDRVKAWGFREGFWGGVIWDLLFGSLPGVPGQGHADMGYR